MKILNLRFKNINSLSGENKIDFTNPIFVNEGLFAITGKTGAGKSSILDAISLAIYGKTPRVEITGSDNAVMTKGEKDCYSEIVFEVAGEKWKSSWKQELNRNGNLKPVNRVIANADNQIIADQIRACDTKIVEIIGLTFEQFIKVIMLAQGSFAAFLQADKNDKGELLEQITGTEIYADISKRVFERNRTEKEKLDQILVELQAIKILSEKEIKNLVDETVAFEKDKFQLDKELQELETTKKWLSDLENLQKQIHDAGQKLPELEKKAKADKEAVKVFENILKTAKSEYQNQESIFKQVRELDTKISEKEKLLHPILKTLSDLEKNKEKLSEVLGNQKTELEKSQLSLSKKQNWATEHQQYEELVSNYAAIERENRLLTASFDEIEALNIKITELQKELDAKTSESEKTATIFDEKEKNLSDKNKELKTKKVELVVILNNKELSALQSEKENITTFGTRIKSLIEIEKSISKNKKEIIDFDEKIKQSEKIIQQLSHKIANDKMSSLNFENQINLLDENIKLGKLIQSLDEHRLHLKDGEKCPLCGSKEHPFALGNVPQIGAKEKELAVLKNQFQEILNIIKQDEQNLAKLNSDKENNLRNRQKEEKILSENKLKQAETVFEINKLNPDFLISEQEDKLEILNEIYVQKQNEYKQIEKIVKNASDIEKQLANLRDKEIPALQEAKQTAERVKNSTEIAQKLVEQELKTKQDLANTLQEKYKIEYTLFSEILKSYAAENITVLKKHLDTWNDNKKQTEEILSQITILTGNIALKNKELEGMLQSFENKQTDKKNIEADKKKLSVDRQEIFGQKSVEEEENRLKKQLGNAENRKVEAEIESSKSNIEFEKCRAIIVEKKAKFLTIEEQKITEKTEEEIQEKIDERRLKSDEFSQKIGANKQILKSDTDNLKNSRSKLKEKEKQQAVCNAWGRLNELIGSSDGKKYRNFAQALTFEHLITLSNRQLQKMSDRYILKRTDDTTNPFELFVIDKFQNSEERTAQNISGGEKFIVSLSLALGLANIASKNMNIDTMFIDEGFGTLDSDYLDVALNALSNLQSEGKIIGVISHLTELKERIATHIEVLPSGNGRSIIQITG
ncbi:MAG: AAA family ATPase [Paludibacteraceae bacterium]